MAYKRTTRSGSNGSRTTHTQSTKGPNRSSKVSTSSGTKNSRVTATTNLNTGERKSYLTQRDANGWISKTSLSSTKGPNTSGMRSQNPKPTWAKSRKYKKSRPIKFSTVAIFLFTLYLISVMVNL